MKSKLKVYVTIIFLIALLLNILVLSPVGMEKSGARYFLQGCGEYRPSHLLYCSFLMLYAVYSESDFMDETNGRAGKLFILYIWVSVIMSRTAYRPELNCCIIALWIFTLITKTWWNFLLVGTSVLCYVLPSAYHIYKYGRFDQILLEGKRKIISNAYIWGPSGVANRQNPYCGLPMRILEEMGWIPLILLTAAFMLFIAFTFKTAKWVPNKQQSNICLMIGIQLAVEVIYAMTELINPLPVSLYPYIEYYSLGMRLTYLFEFVIILQIHLHNRLNKNAMKIMESK